MHWHILGAGAIGGLWAMRMAELGHVVTLLSHDSAASERTLTLEANGQRHSTTFLQRPLHEPGNITQLLVTTKAHHSQAALARLLPALAADTPVWLLQNGMGVEQWLQSAAPDIALLTGISTDGVRRRDRNTLVLAGQGETLIGAEGNTAAALATRLAGTLQDPHWSLSAVSDIRQRRWRKLAINCAINPLTAIYRCRNGELLDSPERLAEMQAICAEVASVMQAEGLPASAAELFAAACDAAEKTAANISSMHADVAADRATEIDFINGHVVRTATRHGLSVPLNTALVQRLQRS